ncbi:hypothetical protein H9639_04750 [Arthrobacter sp. Sa2CUA1]|uniref:Uncharacterized protein n=1 Tax=Arthrobacter gallicola TaxID=2762225 RepID=A0ABR8UPX1_9MICC|nr:hypothetical protein [Arthrobacter gallicola]MBD7994601.1 hypothetical protein [Arthrobacter gallicola]
MPSPRRRSVMLYRRARTALILVGVFWLWLLFGSAAFVASLFDSPFYAMLALYAVGALTLISLLIAPVALAYLLMNRRTAAPAPAAADLPVTVIRPDLPAQPPRSAEAARFPRSDLAPVIRMIPRKVKDSGTALGSRAAAKWRDLAS